MTADDIWKVEPDEAKAIYHTAYWNTVRGGELPAGVNLVVFDVAVNSGPRRVIRMLKEAVRVSADGLFGPVTMRAVMVSPAAGLIDTLAGIRRRFYESLTQRDPSQCQFLAGWLNRVAATTAAARQIL